MICNHLVIHICTNNIFEKHAVFLYLIDAGVSSTFFCIGYSREFDGAHYYILLNAVSLFFLRLLLM